VDVTLTVVRDGYAIGAEGEAIFSQAFNRSGLPALDFFMYENMLWGAGPGDIDRLVIGPSGIWVWDVKHWGHAYPAFSEVVQEQRSMTIHEAEYVYFMLQDAMADVGLDEVQVGWAMTKVQQPYEYLDGLAVCSVDRAMEGMRDNDPVIGPLQVLELVKASFRAFKAAGTPHAR
jgi:hypothetical protein